MGFTVDRKGETRAPKNPNDIRAEIHDALDRIMDSMDGPNGVGGGECEIEGSCEAGHTHVFRLTYCDFTGEKKCVWCNGTGVEKS